MKQLTMVYLHVNECLICVYLDEALYVDYRLHLCVLNEPYVQFTCFFLSFTNMVKLHGKKTKSGSTSLNIFCNMAIIFL